MAFTVTRLYIEDNKIHADGVDPNGRETAGIITIPVHGLLSDDGLCSLVLSQEALHDIVALIDNSLQKIKY